MGLDTFEITVIFIVVATLVAAFVRRIKRDKCLKDFTGYFVNLNRTDGKTVWGKLRVENTGLELIYRDKHKDAQGHEETSYILYKYEYPNIQTVFRFHHQLSDKGRKKRLKELQRTYHPNFLRRLKRKTANLFKTIRDSFAEVINLLISRAKRTAGLGATLTTQDKYVSQMKQELMGSVATSYEPLLERYIGRKVVLELLKGDNVVEYPGVLKDYTAEFIEIMDVDYKTTDDELASKADLVAPRQYAVVRHLGE